jgi:hypothetical protein
VNRIFAFPNPVNEKAARVVAGAVFVVSIVALATSAYWLLVPLAYGFVARALSGPTLSPLGRLASSVIAPRLGPARPVPGPPKRFAQAIGALMSTTAAVLALAFGLHAAADVLLGALILASGAESILAFCIGCQIFNLGMRVGLVPAAVCAECADITSRAAAT